MKKAIDYSYRGKRADIGEMIIMRLIPNNKTQAIGPFVFLDYVSPMHFPSRVPKKPDGHGAHPHRGIATFTYLLHGEFEHFDNKENYGIVNDGGGQWMKAGNGIIHDENFSQAFQKSGGQLQGFQFWINLPSEIKKEMPDYMAVHDKDLPKITLPADAGMLKIVIGTYEGKTSKVKTFTEQFLYHIKLNAGKSFTLPTHQNLEYGAIIPNGSLKINDETFNEGDLLVFSNNGEGITLENITDEVSEILVFGGEHYNEPIVAQGPFVMNTEKKIAEAYDDFYTGKYGVVTHSKGKIKI